jgi:signal transduction histidine kinase
VGAASYSTRAGKSTEGHANVIEECRGSLPSRAACTDTGSPETANLLGQEHCLSFLLKASCTFHCLADGRVELAGNVFMSHQYTIEAKGKQERALRASVVAASWFIIGLGSVMAAAWLSRGVWPEAIWPGFFYMKFNTSLAFISSGIGLVAALRRSTVYTLATGGFVLLTGGVTLLQYLTGANFGFDELLLSDFHYPDNPYPGRMAPAPSLAFTCAGIQLLLAARDDRPWLSTAMETLGFLIFVLGAEGFFGHLQGNANAYSWGSYARMAPQAAAGFMGLGAGLLALAWYRQNIHIARVPLWVPGLLCLVVLLFDISTPRGVAAGIAYIPLVFCSLWFIRPQAAFVFAAIPTALTVIAYFAKAPSDIENWIVLLNRFLTIGALWFVATLVYMRRTTEQALRQSEAGLIRHANALERSNKDLDEFAYIASHDLREPLRGLFTNSTFLQEDYQDKIDAQGVKRLRRICLLSQRMDTLISELLYFSRIGRQQLEIQPTDLNAAIRDIASTMETTLNQRNATISIPRPLPEVICDKPRICEIFRNLIANAIKYNESDDKIVEIGFLDNSFVNNNTDEQVFYVRDNGIGIEQEFHEEIFRIFKRLNIEDDAERGTGVGLTFVRKIVGRHGGRIWLESERGRGTTFYFTSGTETIRCGGSRLICLP